MIEGNKLKIPVTVVQTDTVKIEFLKKTHA